MLLSRMVGVKEERLGGVSLLPRRSRRGSQDDICLERHHIRPFPERCLAGGRGDALTGAKDWISDWGLSMKRLDMLVSKLRRGFCGCARRNSY